MNKFPNTFKNIDSQDELQAVRNYLDTHTDRWGEVSQNNYWQGRTLFHDSIEDGRVRNIIIDVLSKGVMHMKESMNIEKPIYCEHLSIARWPVGYELQPHADAENPPGSPKHDFPWRDFALVTFLNDDFEGGTLFFPDHNLKIEPKPGYSIYFPGTLEYLHGVTKITSGVRYTIASFLTYDEKYSHIKINEISV